MFALLKIAEQNKLAPLQKNNALDVWHVAVPVKDLERSKEFYCNKLGFILLGQDEYTTKKQAFVAVAPSGFTIELFEPKGAEKSKQRKLPDHLAFECQDIGIFHARILSEGLKVDSVEEFDNGVKYFGLSDPDGVKLDFFQGRTIYERSLQGVR